MPAILVTFAGTPVVTPVVYREWWSGWVHGGARVKVEWVWGGCCEVRVLRWGGR